MTAPEGKKISWSTGRGQFARQSFLSSNQGRATHVETCGESHQDRGSTPLASTSLSFGDLRRFSVQVETSITRFADVPAREVWGFSAFRVDFEDFSIPEEADSQPKSVPSRQAPDSTKVRFDVSMKTLECGFREVPKERHAAGRELVGGSSMLYRPCHWF